MIQTLKDYTETCHGGNRSLCANALGVSRVSVIKWLRSDEHFVINNLIYTVDNSCIVIQNTVYRPIRSRG